MKESMIVVIEGQGFAWELASRWPTSCPCNIDELRKIRVWLGKEYEGRISFPDKYSGEIIHLEIENVNGDARMRCGYSSLSIGDMRPDQERFHEAFSCFSERIAKIRSLV